MVNKVVQKHIQHNKQRKHNKQTQSKYDNYQFSEKMNIKLQSILK